jgi:hypothetical protein
MPWKDLVRKMPRVFSPSRSSLFKAQVSEARPGAPAVVALGSAVPQRLKPRGGGVGGTAEAVPFAELSASFTGPYRPQPFDLT